MIMTIIRKNSLVALILILSIGLSFAGNPDRMGQAGAFELMINPYARSAGFHSVNTSRVQGLEAMRLNVAGLAQIKTTEIVFAQSDYLVGSGTNISVVGFGQSIGESGSFGIEAMSMNWGNIPLTTEEVPSGELGSFSPRFLNVAVAYSQRFSEFISAGIVLRVISESIANVGATGVAFDAGVQYTTGPFNNFKFGVSLRNLGTPLKFSGDGLAVKTELGENNFQNTVQMRVNQFELPSMLHIGLSYDFLPEIEDYRVTAAANFQSNSFSTDVVGFGLEGAVKEMFMFRIGYQISEDASYLNELQNTYAYSGPAAGLTLQLPTSDTGEGKIAFDYAYRATLTFRGVHTVGVHVDL